jgi:hypothetical protein
VGRIISSIRANNGIVEFAVCDVIYPIRLGMHMARFISMGALMASRRSPVMHSKVTSGLRRHKITSEDMRHFQKPRNGIVQVSNIVKIHKIQPRGRRPIFWVGVPEQFNGEIILLSRHCAILNGDRDKVTHKAARNHSE